jgi:hypothetical protein
MLKWHRKWQTNLHWKRGVEGEFGVQETIFRQHDMSWKACQIQKSQCVLAFAWLVVFQQTKPKFW